MASTYFGIFGHHISTFTLLCFAKGHWWGYDTRNEHTVHIINLMKFYDGVSILEEVSRYEFSSFCKIQE